MRRTLVLMTVIALLATGLMVSPNPASATRPHKVDPSQIDPKLLALPQSALPPGATVDHSAVSDNPDADGNTKPADGFQAQLHIVHQNFYEVLGRLTGYRMDFHYTVQGSPVGTEYLASVFPSADKARAAMDDATAPGSLITLIGQPLPHQCTAGDACKAFSGPNPGAPTKAVLAIFTDGPILVETASQVPVDKFDALEPSIETALFSLLAAADKQVQIALEGSGPPATAMSTAPVTTPAATQASPPVPPPTATPKPAPKKHKTCKKGYKLVHGKCKKKKKKL